MGKWDIETDPGVLGQMLALLAHDLRNPLSALHSNLGYLQTVTSRKANADPDVAEAIGDGLISCEGLSHIIDNVNLFAQLLRGSAQAAPVPSGFSALVSEALQHGAGLARAHGVSVDLEVSSDASRARVNLSRDLLTRALSNLVRNCVQHSPTRSRVEVRLSADEARVFVRFSDNGPSLPVGEDKRTFGVVFQLAQKTGTEGRYNRWIGLYVTDIAADALGGRLSVETPESPFTSCLQLALPRAGTG